VERDRDETVWTDPDEPTLIPYRRAKTVAERDIAKVLRDKLGATAAHVGIAELPDDAVREAAREQNPALRAIIPALGRRSTHSAAKAEKVLGWRSRPASESIADCAASLVEHGLVPPVDE
jgi:dihydroflavonol-4-reductase